MSIWSSYPGDAFLAHPVDYTDPTDEPTVLVDVATAKSWNGCVRLTILGEAGNDAAVMIPVGRVWELVELLEGAAELLREEGYR